jgi:hypothetical protein
MRTIEFAVKKLTFSGTSSGMSRIDHRGGSDRIRVQLHLEEGPLWLGKRWHRQTEVTARWSTLIGIGPIVKKTRRWRDWQQMERQKERQGIFDSRCDPWTVGRQKGATERTSGASVRGGDGKKIVVGRWRDLAADGAAEGAAGYLRQPMRSVDSR